MKTSKPEGKNLSKTSRGWVNTSVFLRQANLSTFLDRHYDTAFSSLIGFRRHTIMAGVEKSEIFMIIYFVLLLLTFITLTRYIDKVYGCIVGKGMGTELGLYRYTEKRQLYNYTEKRQNGIIILRKGKVA